ncbi:hypothetical protein HanPSC8_Chr00c251g0806861 [Helianthus annuus]|nr:hypothetical protein HanPSC8_Chr00c251g0806861 [Helianthus annuus]
MHLMLNGYFHDFLEERRLSCHPCSPWVFNVLISFFIDNLSPLLLNDVDALCHSLVMETGEGRKSFKKTTASLVSDKGVSFTVFKSLLLSLVSILPTA